MSFLRKKKSRTARISRLVADLQSPPKRDGSLVVETGFPTSFVGLSLARARVNLSEEFLRENIGAFVNALLRAKPAGLKKASKYAGYVNAFHICSTVRTQRTKTRKKERKEEARSFLPRLAASAVGLVQDTPLIIRAYSSTMVGQGFQVDLSKPLVAQVGHLGEDYEEWVHQATVSKEGPRFFESNILEFFTRTRWWVIPLVWVPVACWFISLSAAMGQCCSQLALLTVTGIFVWTLLEYMLHRFLFHSKTRTYWTNTMHYLLHGCHHKHPMDSLRLVFPPAAAAIIATPVWNLIKLLSTPSTAPALFAGVLLGYVTYDLTHYYLHHGQPSSSMPKRLKKYHLNHHYREQNMGFGITSSIWDWVFGTLPPPPKAGKKST
ncbi:hypothetical protein SAY87_004669 [Trapa incisa]|uniref:Fatty acid hydroxylase domain-containing protein n=1 Tax=Trapa incisa TaxID=236973 RepID=A0AAN7PL39_9MYRT|nr:hypothetical protein SAY87_004669 [Trapa incisa]